MTDRIENIWQTIEQWCTDRAPALVEALAGGVSDETMQEAGDRFDHDWPRQLEASLRRHDGWEAYVVHGSWRLLSADEIVETWGRIREVGFGRDPALPGVGEPEGPVEPVFWSDDWLPFAEAAQGRFACLDLAPPEKGEVGQVVDFWHQDTTRRVLASSYGGWLEEFADDLAAGGYWLEGESSLVPSDEAGEAHREETSMRVSESAVEMSEAAEFVEMLAEAGMIELADEWREASVLVEEIGPILAGDGSEGEKADRLLEVFEKVASVEGVGCGAAELSHLIARW